MQLYQFPVQLNIQVNLDLSNSHCLSLILATAYFRGYLNTWLISSDYLPFLVLCLISPLTAASNMCGTEMCSFAVS